MRSVKKNPLFPWSRKSTKKPLSCKARLGLESLERREMMSTVSGSTVGSPNGLHQAWIDQQGAYQRVMEADIVSGSTVNVRQVGPGTLFTGSANWPGITGLQFSPNSANLGWIGSNSAGSSMWENGTRLSGTYNMTMSGLQFSPNSAHLACAVQGLNTAEGVCEDTRFFPVTYCRDGVDTYEIDNLIFTGDSAHLAWTECDWSDYGKGLQEMQVKEDGTFVGPVYHHISGLTSSPKGAHLAFMFSDAVYYANPLSPDGDDVGSPYGYSGVWEDQYGSPDGNRHYDVANLAFSSDGASYSFDSEDNGVWHHVVYGQVATTTTLTASANPSAYGQTVTLTAKVSAANSSTPAGTVTFLDGNTVLGSANLNSSGLATFSVSTLAAGPHSITASYGATTSFEGSQSTALTETVFAMTASAISSSQVNLCWNQVPNASGYQIKYEVNNGAWQQLTTLTGSNSSCTVNGLGAGTTYGFDVGACTSGGVVWAPYKTATTFPAAASLTASAISTSQISLSWTASYDAQSYLIDYLVNGSWKQLASLAASNTGCTVNGLALSTTYTFEVGAYNSSGVTWSPSASATTLGRNPHVAAAAMIAPTSASVDQKLAAATDLLLAGWAGSEN
jgi:hypothetical protein